ncbi:secretory phospholipase A2 receptor [Amia ocellicauda]|uniref:secretory phospholipase A2 receptor n=1 Tax=Amia ocellicauda TaxID=2972642 RepID=UPI003463A1D2
MAEAELSPERRDHASVEGKGRLILLLTVLCPLGSCHFRQFYFINKTLNWTEAQRYCRDNYTDLASIDKQKELDQLLNVTHSPGTETAWIGLRRDCRENWQWSDGEELRFTHWKSHLPCTALNTEGSWENRSCQETNYFICETQAAVEERSPEKYTFIQFKLSWEAAQNYCRANHLVTVYNKEQQDRLLSLTNNTKETGAWIGLGPKSESASKGQTVGYSNWTQGHLCVTLDSEGQWEERDCGESNYFLCNTSDRLNISLIQENKTWPQTQKHCREKPTEERSVWG